MPYLERESNPTLLAWRNSDEAKDLREKRDHQQSSSPPPREHIQESYVADGWTGKFEPQPQPAGPPEKGSPQLGAPQVRFLAELLREYWEQEKRHYEPAGKPLSREAQLLLGNFYAKPLLEQVRIVELQGQRISNPCFFEQARAMGIRNLPDISHQASMTFLDVIVFNEQVSERKLFHGLVHAAQAQILGVGRYAELFVRGFLKTRSYFMVPLKAHAFALDLRFAQNPASYFSVEEEIRRWWSEGRY